MYLVKIESMSFEKLDISHILLQHVFSSLSFRLLFDCVRKTIRSRDVPFLCEYIFLAIFSPAEGEV